MLITRSFSRSRSYIERVVSTFDELTEGLLTGRDLLEYLRMAPAEEPPRRAPSEPATKQARSSPARRSFRGLSIEDVGYRYPRAETWAIRGVSFRIAEGTRVAIVGENGAGKSTLIKIIAGLYEPTEGSVLLNGIDISEYDPHDLRARMGIVFQDFVRFQFSAFDNIALGKLEARDDRARVERAARLSRADQVIARLPDGYSQVLGRGFETAVDLSRGEWQRLAMARAFMRQPDILILDEPTASLDARIERDMFRMFAARTDGRTVILVSHRFSTVRIAQHIVVLSDGTVQEEGSHEQLVSRKGHYAGLFEAQAVGYQ
jgi:ATP-binding cassette subfamily B protein